MAEPKFVQIGYTLINLNNVTYCTLQAEERPEILTLHFVNSDQELTLKRQDATSLWECLESQTDLKVDV